MRAWSSRIKWYARHGIEFGDKVHLVFLDSWHAHDELSGNVKDREEHDREVVGYERVGLPPTCQEHVPSAELE